MHKYEVILYWSNEDRVFVAEVPELPGCMAKARKLLSGTPTRRCSSGLT